MPVNTISSAVSPDFRAEQQAMENARIIGESIRYGQERDRMMQQQHIENYRHDLTAAMELSRLTGKPLDESFASTQTGQNNPELSAKYKGFTPLRRDLQVDEAKQLAMARYEIGLDQRDQTAQEKDLSAVLGRYQEMGKYPTADVNSLGAALFRAKEFRAYNTHIRTDEDTKQYYTNQFAKEIIPYLDNANNDTLGLLLRADPAVVAQARQAYPGLKGARLALEIYRHPQAFKTNTVNHDVFNALSQIYGVPLRPGKVFGTPPATQPTAQEKGQGLIDKAAESVKEKAKSLYYPEGE